MGIHETRISIDTGESPTFTSFLCDQVADGNVSPDVALDALDLMRRPPSDRALELLGRLIETRTEA